ncbi:spectrin binding protein [Aureococcus anophagefferens]|uniref:Spectrin binding protein n=1 Tax=Aureococcus anophagefferens TaxID=44056 RepID=A0ABR1FSX6_AURAN
MSIDMSLQFDEGKNASLSRDRIGTVVLVVSGDTQPRLPLARDAGSPGAMFDVSAWFQDAFCSNVFCTDAQLILCEDAFNPDKPPEEGQVTVREAAPLPAVNSNKRRAASLKLAARLKTAVLQNAGKNALHADCARYCEAARDQICREGLGAWARLVPSGHRLTHADFQKVLGVLGVGPEGVENPRWCVRAWAAAAEGSEARQDRERQLRALGIAGAALDRPDPHTGNTALLIAAAENAVGGRDAPLNQLVEFGADLLAKNKKGQTPLLVAAGKGHADAFRALAWCLERDGKLAEAAILTVTRDRASVLDLIVDRGDAPMLIEALGFADLRALVDLKTRGGDTPLIVAARRGRRDCAAALLDHGAKLEATNAQGHTALHTAAEHGRAPVLEELRGALTDAALRAALAAKVASLPPSGVQGVVVAIYGREILALKRTWHASSIDFAELHDFSCDRAAKHLAEPRPARAIATMPADAWVEVAGYGGVGVAVSLRCCSAQLRLGPNIFASVFADATRERFPAMALAVVAANGRESDHEAIYKSLHEAVASRLSPRPLVLLAPPLPQRDQFAFTVEIIHFDKVVISTTASIPDNTSLCTSRLYTPPLSFDRIVDQDGRVRDPVSARVFCVNMTTGHAALIYNEALTQKTVISRALTADRRLGRAGERFVVDGASLVLEPTVESLYWFFALDVRGSNTGVAQLEFVVKRRRYYFFTNVFAPVTAFVLAPARVTFDAHAKGGELGVGDVKRALVDFGIYFSHAQTDRAVRIVVPASKANRVLDFEGDEGDGDDAPAKVRTFATFVLVLSAIEGHQQRAFSETSTSFADEPRSKQIDEVAFACYFPAYLVFLAIMFARIDSYSG